MQSVPIKRLALLALISVLAATWANAAQGSGAGAAAGGDTSPVVRSVRVFDDARALASGDALVRGSGSELALLSVARARAR